MLKNSMPRHPRARIDGNGNLITDYVLVSCATSSEDCYYPKNKENDPVEVTRSLFDEILTLTNAKIVLLVLDGQDDDPIVTYIRDRGVDVVDVRRTRNGYLEWDDIHGYDNHPGAVAHYRWYRKLMTLLENGALQ